MVVSSSGLHMSPRLAISNWERGLSAPSLRCSRTVSDPASAADVDGSLDAEAGVGSSGGSSNVAFCCMALSMTAMVWALLFTSSLSSSAMRCLRAFLSATRDMGEATAAAS
eukprot:scaffold93430_cov36-Phaeocystis_antarctica.AAC.1